MSSLTEQFSTLGLSGKENAPRAHVKQSAGQKMGAPARVLVSSDSKQNIAPAKRQAEAAAAAAGAAAGGGASLESGFPTEGGGGEKLWTLNDFEIGKPLGRYSSALRPPIYIVLLTSRVFAVASSEASTWPERKTRSTSSRLRFSRSTSSSRRRSSISSGARLRFSRT